MPKLGIAEVPIAKVEGTNTVVYRSILAESVREIEAVCNSTTCTIVINDYTSIPGEILHELCRALSRLRERADVHVVVIEHASYPVEPRLTALCYSVATLMWYTCPYQPQIRPLVEDYCSQLDWRSSLMRDLCSCY